MNFPNFFWLLISNFVLLESETYFALFLSFQIKVCLMAYHVVYPRERLLTIKFHCEKHLLSDYFFIVFQIVVIMRGLPGSGKTHVAKLIRVSMGKPMNQLLLLAPCLLSKQQDTNKYVSRSIHSSWSMLWYVLSHINFDIYR